MTRNPTNVKHLRRIYLNWHPINSRGTKREFKGEPVTDVTQHVQRPLTFNTESNFFLPNEKIMNNLWILSTNLEMFKIY